ncbi:MAG: LptE family protein [Bacteroidetes bacterium]|nr:LptE family protein [Bacteroidota bacterium]
MFRKFIFLILLLNALGGCKYIHYSFKEGSTAAEVKSISIAYIQNNASVIVPQLSQQLTDKLRQKFLSETRLDMVNSGGDFDIKGTITSYIVEPVSLQAGQKASQNQLKISVQIQFVNKQNPKSDFNETFTQYAEFGSDKSLTSVELGLISLITEKLTQAIFNKTLSDW